jgi:hypothetical protein
MLGTVPKYSSAALTIAALSPSHILAPANGGFIVGGNTAFTWSPGVGATQYVLTVTQANGQSTQVVVNPSATPGATVSLPTAKSESNNKLDNCWRRAYSKVDDQVHAWAVCFESGKTVAEGVLHLERVSGEAVRGR